MERKIIQIFLTSVVILFSFSLTYGQAVTDNQNTTALSQDMTQTQKGFEVPKQHRVADGDTLWHLAGRYYSNPFLWGRIYNANLNVIKNPDLIHPADELVIPDVTEQVKPSEPVRQEPPVAVLQKVEEIPKETEVELTSEAKSEDLTEPSSEDAVELPKTELPSSQGARVLPEISELMPTDQKEWYSMLDISVVPMTWKEDGVVTGREGDDEFNEVSFSGQHVALKMTGNKRASKGDIFVVYKRGSAVYNEQGKAIGKEIQKSALVEIIKTDKSTAIAKIISANTAVSEGYLVKKK